MKRIESVKLSGINGERVDVVTFARWKKMIAGIEFSFALHLLPSFKVGLPNKLWVSELGTGFNTLVVVKHPVSGQHMTDVMADKLGQSYVVRLAKSALHNQLKACGDGAFIDGLVRAEMLLAKQQRQRELAAEPKCEACEDTGFQAEQGPEGELCAVECHACLDSKVVVTTDKDHEGQPIEARCPECVEQNGGLNGGTFQVSGTLTEVYRNQAKLDELMACGKHGTTVDGVCEHCENEYTPSPEEAAAALADADTMNQNMAKYGTIDAPQNAYANVSMEYMTFPTEQEWYESLTVRAKLDYLAAEIANQEAASKELSARATKADYDRIDDMDARVVDLQQQRRELLWDHRNYLQERTDQHSTMTGDTTEQEYETLTEELADTDKQIHDLENPPCSK